MTVFRLIAGIGMCAVLTLGGTFPCEAGQPEEDQIVAFLNADVHDSLEVHSLKYKVFPGSSDSGRVSVSGSLMFTEDWVSQRNHAEVLDQILAQADVSSARFYEILNVLFDFPVSPPPKLWFINHMSGTTIPFRAELQYFETIDGFEFQGDAEYTISSAMSRSDYEYSRNRYSIYDVFVPSPEFDALMNRVVEFNGAAEATIQSAIVNIAGFRGGAAFFIGDVPIAVIDAFDPAQLEWELWGSNAVGVGSSLEGVANVCAPTDIVLTALYDGELNDDLQGHINPTTWTGERWELYVSICAPVGHAHDLSLSGTSDTLHLNERNEFVAPSGGKNFWNYHLEEQMHIGFLNGKTLEPGQGKPVISKGVPDGNEYVLTDNKILEFITPQGYCIVWDRSEDWVHSNKKSGVVSAEAEPGKETTVRFDVIPPGETSPFGDYICKKDAAVASPAAAEPAEQQDLASVPAGLEGVAALVAEAEALYGAALAAEGPERADAFRQVQALLDQIATDHPASDEAVQLLLDLPIGSVDPARVREGMGVAAIAPSATPDADGPDERQDLRSLLAACLEGVDPLTGVRDDLQITVAAQVGPAGEVVGVPALVLPASVDADTRRLFQRAVSAIDACAPFGDEVRNRELVVILDAGSLLSVAVGSTRPVGSETPSEQPVLRSAAPAQPEERGEVADLESPKEGSRIAEEIAAAAPLATTVPTADIVEGSPVRQEREIVRDVQTELNRVGCDAGAADGIAGRNTRTAFRDFVETTGVDLGEDSLATEEALVALRAQTGVVCKPREATRNEPSNLAGNWGWRAECPGIGRMIRNEGSMNLRYVGSGRLEGPARNVQGNRGQGVIQVSGTRASSFLSYGFFRHRSNMRRTSTSPVTFAGTAARDCRIVMWKR